MKHEASTTAPVSKLHCTRRFVVCPSSGCLSNEQISMKNRKNPTNSSHRGLCPMDGDNDFTKILVLWNDIEEEVSFCGCAAKWLNDTPQTVSVWSSQASDLRTANASEYVWLIISRFFLMQVRSNFMSFSR